MSGFVSEYGGVLFAAILLYLAVISLTAAIVTIVDKHRASRQKGRRVPENTLMVIAALGGAVTMLITMLMIRHKTCHIKFMLGLPIIIVFQAVVALWLTTRIS